MTLFLSYSTKDESIVRSVEKYIPKEMIDVWIDHKKIGGGRDLKRAIKSGIKNADVFFLFISKEALSSDWVKKELALAKKKEKELKYEFIVPVVLEQNAWENWKDKELKGRKYIEFDDGNIDMMAHEIKDTIVNKTIEKYEHQCLLKRNVFENFGSIVSGILIVIAFSTTPTKDKHIGYLQYQSNYCKETILASKTLYRDMILFNYVICPIDNNKDVFSIGAFGLIFSREIDNEWLEFLK